MGVACASVIARYTFLKHMQALREEHNLDLPLGAGTKVDIAISKVPQEKLKYVGKLNFKNFNK
jgi:ribonuclease HIII